MKYSYYLFAENAVPQLQALSILEVTSGVQTTFTLAASDLDGDPLTYHVEGDDVDETLQLNQLTGDVTYTPHFDKPVNLR